MRTLVPRLLGSATAICFSLGFVLHAANTATAQDGRTDGDTEERESQPCRTLQYSIVSSGYQEKHLFNGVNWVMQGVQEGNSARYKGTGNDAPGLVVSADRKWEWVDPYAKFVCNEGWYWGQWVQQYLAVEQSGMVVPYGTEDEARSETVSSTAGGDSPNKEEKEVVWYVCWYYVYSDGSRSAYYRCDPM